jgi:hypothetical protein
MFTIIVIVGVGIVAATEIATRGALSKQCIRFMHETIIKHSYTLIINPQSHWDISLKSLRNWLIDLPTVPHLLPYYPQLPSLPESFSNLHSYYVDNPSNSSENSSMSLNTNNSSNPSPIPTHALLTPSNTAVSVISNISEIFMNDLAFNDHHHLSVNSSTFINSSSHLSDIFMNNSPKNSTGLSASPSNVSNVMSHQIRGVRDNWVKRFGYFAGSYINSRLVVF